MTTPDLFRPPLYQVIIMVMEGRSGSSVQRRIGPVIVGKVIAHFLHQVLEVGLTGDHLIDEGGQRPPRHRLHH